VAAHGQNGKTPADLRYPQPGGDERALDEPANRGRRIGPATTRRRRKHSLQTRQDRSVSLNKNVELRRQRAEVSKKLDALAERGFKTEGDKSKFDQLMRDAQDLDGEIKRIEGAMEIYAEVRKSGKPPESDPTRDFDVPQAKADLEYRKAFGTFLRNGRGYMSPSELATLETRDMGEGSTIGALGPAGGSVLVPVGFQHEISIALKTAGCMLDPKVVRILDTDSGQPLPWPTENDVQNQGVLIAESQQVPMIDTVVSNILFGAWKWSSGLIKVSMELVQDSAFSIEDFLKETMAVRIGRAMNQYFTTGLGSGSQQPYGVVPAVIAAGNTLTAIGAYPNDGVSGANSIGTSDIFALIHAVDPLYRAGGRSGFMMHDQVYRALLAQLDKYGRPIWGSLQGNQPDMLAGYPVFINNALDELQTQTSSPQVTRNVVAFGRLDKYVVRRVKEFAITVLRERFADFGLLAYIGWARADGNLLYSGGTCPLALLQTIY
jgi:HK97 family phage major capsid protein